jgi:hypothetical protein
MPWFLASFIIVQPYGPIHRRKKLQKVQNFAARIVTGTKKFVHITPSLKQLNWLPVNYMLRFRDTVMVYKCIYRFPAYIKPPSANCLSG